MPDLPADSGSPDFSFDRDNHIVKLSRIIGDLCFRREGESVEKWRDRLGITTESALGREGKISETLEGLEVMFDLMRRAPVDYLFTKHGINKAAAWRFIRRVANDGKQVLEKYEEPMPDAVREFIESYRFVE